MKIRILLFIWLFALAANLSAQDSSGSGNPRRTQLEVVGGPTFTRYETNQILPSVNYQFGGQVIRKLRRSALQLGIQYLPMEAAFAGFNLKTTNHTVSTSILYQLPLIKSIGLTLSGGLSYGVAVAQTHSYSSTAYPANGVAFCGSGPRVEPTLYLRQSALLGGLSWRPASRYLIALSASLGAGVWDDYYALAPGFYMIQLALGYRII